MSKIEVGLNKESAGIIVGDLNGFVATTIWADPDEGCFELQELNLPRPDGSGVNRYRISYIARNDKMLAIWEDLGLARKFASDQFRIPGGVRDESTGKFLILHTLAELREIAQYMHTQKSLAQSIEPTDLIGAYHRKQEEKKYRRKSTYGYGGHKQRD